MITPFWRLGLLVMFVIIVCVLAVFTIIFVALGLSP